MEHQPISFSVIIPAYNSAGYVANAIASVVAAGQNNIDYEVLVIDDGSTDDTAQIVNHWATKNPRIKLYTKPNGNWGSVINYVRDNHLATKTYSLILDSDDTLHPKCFVKATKAMRGADALLMAFLMREKHYSLYVLPYLFLSREVKLKNRFTISFVPFSVIFRTSLFYAAAPRLREKVRYQDSHLLFTLLKAAPRVRFSHASSGIYNRARPGNTTTAPWDDKRFAEECMLHEDLATKGFNEFLAYRPLLVGYPKIAKQKNYKIKVNARPHPWSQPWWMRWLFWLIYACKMHRYLQIQKPAGHTT